MLAELKKSLTQSLKWVAGTERRRYPTRYKSKKSEEEGIWVSIEAEKKIMGLPSGLIT